jgi:hypothetical protein
MGVPGWRRLIAVTALVAPLFAQDASAQCCGTARSGASCNPLTPPNFSGCVDDAMGDCIGGSFDFTVVGIGGGGCFCIAGNCNTGSSQTCSDQAAALCCLGGQGSNCPGPSSNTAEGATASFTFAPLPTAPDSGPGRNINKEPGIAVAPDGAFWIAATRGPFPFVSDVWRSTDGGSSYQWMAAPFNPVPGSPVFGFAGHDADVAVATAANAQGHYNVYVANHWLNVTGNDTKISMAISQDAGTSWIIHPLAGEVPGDDRPWLATDGACTVYLAYHATPATTTVVNKYDLCDPIATLEGVTLVPIASTRYVDFAPGFAQNQPDIYVNSSFGKIIVDTSSASPYRHRVYLPAMDCGALSPVDEIQRALNGSNACPGPAEVHMLVSADGGLSWSLHPVATSTNNVIPIWSVWAAVDAAGTVYFSWFDNHDVFLNVSHDGGETWSPWVHVNQSPSLTAILPTAAAGVAGTVEIAWYGADRAGNPGDASVMGSPGSATGAAWRVYWARSTDGGTTFAQTAATDVVHRGAECVEGDSCDLFAGERDLWDDFGVAISPVTGRASIAYSSDQPEGDPFHVFTGYATERP